MKNIILLWILFVLTAQTSFSQTFDKDKLDIYFKTLETNDKFMGNILVCKNGGKLYSYSAGYSNVENRIRSDESTMYRIGSISKTFTAALVLKAVEEGKISLSQNIVAFFPSIINAEIITIRQLLNHHSGIHNFTGSADFMNWHAQKKSEKEIVTIIAEGGSDFQPGSKAEYSNSNYVLLSYILEHTYKDRYENIINEKIIGPLQLKHTRFGDRTIPQSYKTYSYTYEAGWQKEEDTDLSIPMGAGAIISTAGDLALFIDALFSGKIISEESLNAMKTQSDGYGMGLFKTYFSEKMSFHHNGRIDGFNSVFYYFPEEHIVFVMLSNAENYDINDINTSVLNCVFGKPFAVPVLNIYKITPADLLPYFGVYTSKNSPLIITISGKDNMLLAQPKGQKIYTMEATAKDKFKHDKSGVTLEFNPSESKMIMKQGKQTLLFSKQ
ncbi:MAG: serine hydrolase domain-containing protein [Bacteroidota bacterium]